MNDSLALINKSTLEALEENDVVKIIEKFTRTGMEVLSADFGIMFWKLESQNKYQIMYTTPETPYKPKLPRKKGYNYKASEGKLPYFVSDPIKSLTPYMESLAIIPIFYKNYQYGNIVLCFKKKRIFTEAEKPLMTTLGNSAAQVLTIHRSHKKSEKDYIKLLKQKDEFFNIISHELKTPVTTIKGFAQILDLNLKKTDSKTKHFLEKINKQSDKLSRLINDLMDVSRIETGKLRYEKDDFELCDLVTQVVDNLKIALPNNQIDFNADCKFWVTGDSHRIEEVLINLIINGSKYSPMKSKIKVNLKQDGDYARVEIEDFGHGIKTRDKEKVFNRFFQSKDPRTKNLSGLGLVLYISNAIIKHHNGVLNFIPKKKGTVFYFKLPYFKYKAIKKEKNEK
ncbi:MAG TPA: GAF domain-containing sensor histidine kinase [Candidatus Paceibacterota bacterium]